MKLLKTLKHNKRLNLKHAGIGVILFFAIKGTIVTLLALGAIWIAF